MLTLLMYPRKPYPCKIHHVLIIIIHHSLIRSKKLAFYMMISSSLASLLRWGCLCTVFFFCTWVHAAVPDDIARQKDTVVILTVHDKTGEHIASANGFIVAQNGLIVSDCRIVNKWFEEIEHFLRIETEAHITLPVEDVLSSQCRGNLALIRVGMERLPSVRLSEGSLPDKGEKIFTISRSSDFALTMSEGTVQGVDEKRNILYLSLPETHPGNGSPVFNSRGETVGAILQIRGGRGKLAAAASVKGIQTQILAYLKSPSSIRGKRPVYRVSTDNAPASADDYYLSGYTFASLNMLSDAIKLYKESVRLNPDFWQAYVSLGVIYYRTGNYLDAIEAYKEALRLRPESPGIYNKLGTAYMTRGDYASASRSFQKALSIDPYNSSAHFNLGITYLLRDDKTGAYEEYLILKEIDVSRADTLRNLLN
jgi:TolA-binding protein